MDGMRTAWLFFAVGAGGALGGALVGTMIVGSLAWLFRKLRHRCPAPDQGIVFEENRVDAEEALEHVMELTRQDPDGFGRVWAEHVRDAADGLTAQIAGQHMAGEHCGELEWSASVPSPETLHPDDSHAAFRLAVCAEVTARVNGMTGPGAFG